MSDVKDRNQVYVMYAGTLLSFAFSILVTYLNTKHLSQEDFGVFKLYQNAGYLLYVIFNFGIFYSATYLVAQSDELYEQVKLASSGLIVFFTISIALLVLLYFSDILFSDVFSGYFPNGLILLFLSFFSISLINGIQSICQGMNRVEVISFIKFVPYVLYSILFVVLSLADSESSIYLFCFVNILVVAFYAVRSGFFSYNAKAAKLILNSIRGYGFNVYIGSVLGVGCIYFLNTMLPIYLDMKHLAIVGVALTLSSPLQLIPSVIGVVLFRKFSKGNNCFEKEVVVSLLFVSVASILAFNLVIASVVSFLFSDDYVEAVGLSRIIGLGYILYGIGDFFTKFLASRGAGVSLRNTSIIVGFSVIAVFFLTISHYGIYSICYSIVFGGLVFSSLSVFNCQKIIREENDIK